jgi:hypothetical protein
LLNECRSAECASAVPNRQLLRRDHENRNPPAAPRSNDISASFPEALKAAHVCVPFGTTAPTDVPPDDQDVTGTKQCRVGLTRPRLNPERDDRVGRGTERRQHAGYGGDRDEDAALPAKASGR